MSKRRRGPKVSKSERAYRRDRAEREREEPIREGLPGFFYTDRRFTNEHLPGVFCFDRY